MPCSRSNDTTTGHTPQAPVCARLHGTLAGPRRSLWLAKRAEVEGGGTSDGDPWESWAFGRI